MLSTEEVLDYVQGRTEKQTKDHFSLEEARRIGEDLGVRWDIFGIEQFAMGLNVELQHGRRDPETDITHDEPMLTGKIVLVHLKEIPDYYTRLSTMEDESRSAGRPRRTRGL